MDGRKLSVGEMGPTASFNIRELGMFRRVTTVKLSKHILEASDEFQW